MAVVVTCAVCSAPIAVARDPNAYVSTPVCPAPAVEYAALEKLSGTDVSATLKVMNERVDAAGILTLLSTLHLPFPCLHPCSAGYLTCAGRCEQ